MTPETYFYGVVFLKSGWFVRYNAIWPESICLETRSESFNKPRSRMFAYHTDPVYILGHGIGYRVRKTA